MTAADAVITGHAATCLRAANDYLNQLPLPARVQIGHALALDPETTLDDLLSTQRVLAQLAALPPDRVR
jgi:hypothetical protein